MKHFWFVEHISGEEFLVGAHDYAEADRIAVEIAMSIAEQYNQSAYDYDLDYRGTVSDWEAEASGLDEY